MDQNQQHSGNKLHVDPEQFTAWLGKDSLLGGIGSPHNAAIAYSEYLSELQQASGQKLDLGNPKINAEDFLEFLRLKKEQDPNFYGPVLDHTIKMPNKNLNRDSMIFFAGMLSKIGAVERPPFAGKLLEASLIARAKSTQMLAGLSALSMASTPSSHTSYPTGTSTQRRVPTYSTRKAKKHFILPQGTKLPEYRKRVPSGKLQMQANSQENTRKRVEQNMQIQEQQEQQKAAHQRRKQRINTPNAQEQADQKEKNPAIKLARRLLIGTGGGFGALMGLAGHSASAAELIHKIIS